MWNSLSNINYYEGLLAKQLANETTLSETDVDFGNMCRTCLRDAPDSDNLLKDFEIGAMNFNFEGRVLKLIDMLTELTGRKISEVDPLPHQICNNCMQNISGAYFYRLQCQKAENLLHRLNGALNELQEFPRAHSPQSPQPSENVVPSSKKDLANDEEERPTSLNIIEVFPVADDNGEEIESDVVYDDNGDKKMSVEFDGVQYQIDSEIFQEEDAYEEDQDDEENNQTKKMFESEETDDVISDIESGDAKLEKIKIEIIKNSEDIELKDILEEPRNRRKYTRLKNGAGGDGKSYVCEICDAKFTKVQSLKRHVKIHQADQKNKVCSFCSKTFFRSDDLTRHIRTHTGERPYACPLCPKRYKQTSELKEHQLSHSNQKTYTCSICGKVLKTRNGHYVHMRIHMGLKKHICEYCGNRYVTSGELNSHMRHIHEKKKPFLCSKEDCGRSFAAKHALKIHARVHTGERPFQCTYCAKKFSSKAFLSDHLKTHVGSSPHKCYICNKTLVTRQALKKHIQVHLASSEGGKILLECPTCARCFSSLSEIEAHTNDHCTEYDDDMDENVKEERIFDEGSIVEEEIEVSKLSKNDEPA